MFHCHSCNNFSGNFFFENQSKLGGVASDCRPWLGIPIGICANCGLVQKEINAGGFLTRIFSLNIEGKKILDESGLKILSASDLNDAAKKIVGAIK